MNTRDQEPLTPEERDLARRLARLDAHSAPSPALDANILAAARSATGGGSSAAPVRPGRQRPRWPFGLGIAASLAVALGIAWQLRPMPETAVLSAPAADEASAPVGVVADAPPAEPGAGADEYAAPAAAEPAIANEPAATMSAADEPVATPAPPPAAASRAPAAAPPPPPPEAQAAAERVRAADADADGAAQAVRIDEEALARAAAVREAAQRERESAMKAESAPIVFDAPAPAAAPAPAPAVAPARNLGAMPQARPASPPAAAPAQRAATAIGDRTAEPSTEVLDQIVVTGSRASDADSGFVPDQPLDDQPPASVSSPEVRDAWLERIRELRKTGHVDEARASLHEFVRRHPDVPIPDDLRTLFDE